MAQQRPPERERSERTYEENGLAPEMKREAQRIGTNLGLFNLSPVAQGYILMATGIALLLFSVGLFPILKWVIVAASVAMIAVGIFRSDVVSTISNSIERMRTRR